MNRREAKRVALQMLADVARDMASRPPSYVREPMLVLADEFDRRAGVTVPKAQSIDPNQGILFEEVG